jgi:hypothetical protein
MWGERKSNIYRGGKAQKRSRFVRERAIRSSWTSYLCMSIKYLGGEVK